MTLRAFAGWSVVGVSFLAACNASVKSEAASTPDAGDAGSVTPEPSDAPEPTPSPTPSESATPEQPEPQPVVLPEPEGVGGTPPVVEPEGAELANILFDIGRVSPSFTPDQTRYRLDVPLWVERVAIEPVQGEADTTLLIDGEPFDGDPQAIELELGKNTVRIQVEASDARTTEYTVDVYRATQVIEDLYAKARLPNAGMQFGFVTAVSGDIIAVGAPGDGTAARGVNGDEGELGSAVSGAVYVLVKTASDWEQQAFLKAHNADSEDRFGTSLAISGDTLVVGAPSESGGSPGVDGANNDDLPSSGAAYVFERRDNGWRQTAYLKPELPAVGDYFGQSVAIDGDRIVVGAYADSNARAGINPTERDDVVPYSGAAYVFEREGNTWVQAAYLKASNPDPGDQFGESVAVFGDTVVVGATGEQSDAADVDGDQERNELFSAGAAYVFTVDGRGNWEQSAYLKSSNPVEEARFGNSISIHGSTIAVGGFTEPTGGTGIDNGANAGGGDTDTPESGAVYLFELDDAGWQQTTYIKASNAEERDRFGHTVVLRGDTLVVGASLESSANTGINPAENDNSALGAGAVYVFTRDQEQDGAGTWSQEFYLKSGNAEAGDNFGLGLGFDGVQLVVGAPFEDNEAGGLTMEPSPNNALPESGAVYVFR